MLVVAEPGLEVEEQKLKAKIEEIPEEDVWNLFLSGALFHTVHQIHHTMLICHISSDGLTTTTTYPSSIYDGEVIDDNDDEAR